MRRSLALLGLVIIGFLPKPVFAAPAPAVAAGEGLPIELKADDVHTFMDGLIPYALQKGDVAGAVVVVVKDGKVLFADGYGYADVAKRKPVVADRTLFRMGSISKLFTFTAVMQLVETGRLKLDQDVNSYLDFKLPEAFGKPITLRNLMTHTAGFEDGYAGAVVQHPSDLLPIRTYVSTFIPKRIFPPGQVVAYSNYGATLAGYIVERVSGEPFITYVDNNIMKPLAMSHSSFLQPLPPSLRSDMALGYIRASGRPSEFELRQPVPAGALSATGTDLAQFMIAQLRLGQAGTSRILNPISAKLMQSTQSRMAPGINGLAFGFWEEDRNGLRIIGHDGDLAAFHSALHLLPGKNVGFLIALNSAGKEHEAGKIRTAVFRAFLDRYFPFKPRGESVKSAHDDAKRVSGWYQPSRRFDSTMRLLSIVRQNEVSALPNGDVQVSILTDPSGAKKRWREIGPLIYQEVGGQALLKFVSGSRGQISYWVSDDVPAIVIYQKVSGLNRSPLFIALCEFSIFVIALALIVSLRAVVIAYKGRTDNSSVRRWLWPISRLGLGVLLLAVGGWFKFLSDVQSLDNPALINFIHPHGILLSLYVLGCLSVVGAVATVIEAILRVVRGPGGIVVRAGEAVLSFSCVFSVWVFIQYGLVSFSQTF